MSRELPEGTLITIREGDSIRGPRVPDFNKILFDFSDKLKKVEEQGKDVIKKWEYDSKQSIANVLIGLQTTTAIIQFAAAVSGEAIDLTFLMMISSAVSQMQLIYTQATILAATPGLQGAALILIATLPFLTSMILQLRAGQAKSQAAFDRMNKTSLDSMLNKIG